MTVWTLNPEGDWTDGRTRYRREPDGWRCWIGDAWRHSEAPPGLAEAFAAAVAENGAKAAPNGIGADPSAQSAESAEPPPTVDSADTADSAAVPRAASWEPPSPLGGTTALRPFPVEALPDWLAEWVTAEATATQTPADLAGMLALAALAAAAAGRVEIQPRDGWREPLNLFVAVALPPGNRKSAVFADATAPLAAAEREWTAAAAPAIRQAETERTVAQAAADQARAKAGKAAAAERDAALAEAISAAEHAASITVPPMPRLLADDATPEALAGLLAEHRRIALMSPEGDVFDLMAGRYQSNGGPNLGVYLKGHAGDAIRIDRRGRPPEHVDRPALTVGLAVQPDVLRTIADRPGFRGRGLLARFLYALPASTVGRRQIGAPPMPGAVAARYRAELSDLAGRCNSLASGPDGAPLVLTIDPAAAEALLELERMIEPRLDPDGGDLAHIADWASKLAGAAARIAGLLHLTTDVRGRWDRPVTQPTMLAALSLAGYLTEHALAVFNLMGADPALADARYVLGWIERSGVERFTRRELFSALPRGRFPKVDALDPALTLLESHGYIRQEDLPDRTGPGRRPSPAYLVNPHGR